MTRTRDHLVKQNKPDQKTRITFYHVFPNIKEGIPSLKSCKRHLCVLFGGGRRLSLLARSAHGRAGTQHLPHTARRALAGDPSHGFQGPVGRSPCQHLQGFGSLPLSHSDAAHTLWACHLLGVRTALFTLPAGHVTRILRLGLWFPFHVFFALSSTPLYYLCKKVF